MTHGIDLRPRVIRHRVVSDGSDGSRPLWPSHFALTETFFADEDLNTCLDQPETRWTIQHMSYDTLTSRAKPSSNARLSHCSWSFGIIDESHRYKRKNSVGWRIVMHARMGFKLQVTASPGFHSLYDWCFQTMCLFSGAPEYPEDYTVMEKHGAEALYSAVNSVMHGIWTQDEDDQQDAEPGMIRIAKPWTIRRWSELKLANGKQLLQILKENAHLVDLEWTEEEQAKLKTLVARYTSQGASEAWRVQGWQLICFALVLGVVLATVPDRLFGSGSGPNPNRGQIAGPGCQSTRTVNSGTVRW